MSRIYEILDGIIDKTERPEKSYAFTTNITAVTVTTISTDFKIPLLSPSISGNCFEYDSTNKGIKVLRDCTAIFSVEASYSNSTSGDLMGVSVYVNGTSYALEYNRMGGTYDRICITPTVVSLNKNDVLTVYGRNNSYARGSFNTMRFCIFEV